jgi:hypothetical protein
MISCLLVTVDEVQSAAQGEVKASVGKTVQKMLNWLQPFKLNSDVLDVDLESRCSRLHQL